MTERAQEPKQRIAIIGGGLAGVSLAWLLDGACDVVLFEKNARLGGHSQSTEVVYRGRAHTVDLAAQFFGPKVHPTFIELLETLGLYHPSRPDACGSMTREMGVTMLDEQRRRPMFVSPMFGERRLWPLWTRWNMTGQAAFVLFAIHATRFEAEGDWSITLDEWLRSLRGVTTEYRERLLLPWLSALSGCSIDEARQLSARAAIACPARALPKNPIEPTLWSQTRMGLGGVVDALVARCATSLTHLGSPAASIVRVGQGYRVTSRDGKSALVDQVVLAAPPHATRALVADLAGCERVAEILGRFRYFRTRVAIHTDPLYVHRDRDMWSAYNTVTTEDRCEGSIWYGALRERLDDGSTLDLFKSWVAARRKEPREILCEAEYLHPLIDPEFVRAQRMLAEHQGAAGLWFAGSYSHDVDIQETALVSAIRVAQKIAPRAVNTRRWSTDARLARGDVDPSCRAEPSIFAS